MFTIFKYLSALEERDVGVYFFLKQHQMGRLSSIPFEMVSDNKRRDPIIDIVSDEVNNSCFFDSHVFVITDELHRPFAVIFLCLLGSCLCLYPLQLLRRLLFLEILLIDFLSAPPWQMICIQRGGNHHLIFPRFDGHFSMMRNQGVRDEWKDKTGVRAGVQAADY